MNFKLRTDLFPSVETIIFDLGGVLLNIDYYLTQNAFEQLGVLHFDQAYSQAKQSSLFDDLETGKLNPDQFRDEARRILVPGLSNKQIDSAWNAMLLDLPAIRVQLLKNIRNKYRTFLLSNTNKIHYDAYTKYLEQAHGFVDFAELMEKQYLSFQIGLRKPNADCFQLILDENKLNPNTTLFIDDSIQHVEGAKAVGLQAYHLNVLNGEKVEDLFLT
ncbi:MAG: HAD family phosphatase [Bacteroidia bacterium]|nr:HAD family phosphatase [Bacteroidia bacterium]